MKKRNIIKLLFLAIIISLLFIAVFSKTKININAFTFEVSLNYTNQGNTRLQIPPFGSIEAATHSTPIQINVVLENIDIDYLQEYLNSNTESQAVFKNLADEFKEVLYYFVFKILVLSFLGGLVGSIFVVGRDFKAAILGSITALCVCLLLIFTTYMSFNPQNFQDSKYQGAIKFAPWIITMTETAVDKFNVWEEQIKLLVNNLNKLSERMEQIKPINQDENDIIILHVSDIHNNPVAHELIQKITESFPVDFVINTGDITDYGTPIEGKLLTTLKQIKIPYLFIPGNHDSPEVIKEISKYPQVQVLSAGMINIQGIRIMSYPDPSSTSFHIVPNEKDNLEEKQIALLNIWQNAEIKPHIVAVHNINMAELLKGQAPLILYGHTHQLQITSEKDTVMINAGTTGGAGIRGLQSNKDVPYSVCILYLQHDENNDVILTAVDVISVNNLETGFLMERKTYSLSLGR